MQNFRALGAPPPDPPYSPPPLRISGYAPDQVSFSVKTPKKKHFLNIISKCATFFGYLKKFLGQHYFDIIWGDQLPKTPNGPEQTSAFLTA